MASLFFAKNLMFYFKTFIIIVLNTYIMKNILTLLCILATAFCNAQEKRIKTYLVLNNNNQVFNADSADYIRTIALDKNNEDAFDVVEYYKDKSVKRIGNSLTSDFNPKYNGNVISYFKNGKISSKEPYSNGVLYGIAKYYYANDSLRKQISYINNEKKQRVEKVLALNDSLGHYFLNRNASGVFKIKEPNGEVIEGEYLEGQNHGTWKTYNPEKNENYIDEYDAGKYLKGKTIEADGKIITYNELEQLPEFKGGLNVFGKFLGTNLRYPSEARKQRIQGRVFITFVVEKDGTLTDHKVIRGIGGGCDEEALRVLQKSPKFLLEIYV